MSRCLVVIGVRLIDAGARPEVARWIIDLLKSTGRDYLPLPQMRVKRQYTLLRFFAVDRELIVALTKPGFARWCRIHPDGSLDRGSLDLMPTQLVQELFAWLLEGATQQV